ncbi:MAG: pantoate--beta-alanine ligase [Methylophilaceae bacterium]|jgi:pantoate--beta-alanine ligase
MQVITDEKTLRQTLKGAEKIALVPTMGNLHQGHISLVKQALATGAKVVVSIYVNPLQFGPKEDFSRYPRTLQQDLSLLQNEGVDIVFAPDHLTMYPNFDSTQQSTGQQVMIALPEVANHLCGAHRPGHFNGVATVVLKLFNLVFSNGCLEPIAVFGKKDYQQLWLIKMMVQQLNLPITILSGETMRNPSGLAMSSRNGYLTAEQQQQASSMYQVLQQVAQGLQQKPDFAYWQQWAKQSLVEQGWQLDYIEICQQHSLQAAQKEDKHIVILAAGYIANTRLIDNLECNL